MRVRHGCTAQFDDPNLASCAGHAPDDTGADSIEDLDLVRHGGMGSLFAVRTLSTTYLRMFTFGHVRQLDTVASRLSNKLAGQAPLSRRGRAGLHRRRRHGPAGYGYAKQGAGRGYTGTKGLNALLAIAARPSSAPVLAAATQLLLDPGPPGPGGPRGDQDDRPAVVDPDQVHKRGLRRGPAVAHR